MNSRSGATRDAAPSYLLGHSDRELERLARQALLVDPMTRAFFTEAGVATGMRVLDVGSGAGDVAILAARLVGPGGSVVATDRSEKALAVARARAAQLGLANLSLRVGDPGEMSFDQPFDAVVGRYVVMFQSDHAALLRKLRAHLAPGGVMVFHEPDWYGVQTLPPVPTYDRCCGWIQEMLVRTGANRHMGSGLHAAFVAAGLPAPTLRMQAQIGVGESAAHELGLVADIVATILPGLEAAGITSAAEAQVDSLLDRMRAEAAATSSLVVGRWEVGAWARV